MLRTLTKTLAMFLALAMMATTPTLASGKSRGTPKTCVWKKICLGPGHARQVLPQVQNRIGDKASAIAKPHQAIHDGQWVSVEAVTDLKEVATVYNLRVSDFHTYFVGSREWGFSVWAHNTVCGEAVRTAINEVISPATALGRTTRLGETNLNLIAEAINTGNAQRARQLLLTRVEGMTEQMATQITQNLTRTRLANGFATGAAGEVFLENMYAGGRQVTLETGIGTGATRFRRIDVLADGIAHESKVGFTTLTELVESQIAKDVWLIRNNPEVRGATWHFFRSAETGRIGAAPDVLQALDRAGIRYVIHN